MNHLHWSANKKFVFHSCQFFFQYYLYSLKIPGKRTLYILLTILLICVVTRFKFRLIQRSHIWCKGDNSQILNHQIRLTHICWQYLTTYIVYRLNIINSTIAFLWYTKITPLSLFALGCNFVILKRVPFFLTFYCKNNSK